MDIQKILSLLPHRYPLLLVDRVLKVEAGKTITALKNVTINEPFFAGHFPEMPVMPGVLILEALAQTGGILAFETTQRPEKHRSLLYFAGIDKARFKRIVYPGDQLILKVDLLQVKRDIWKFNGQATVDGKLVCSAEMLAARKDVSSKDVKGNDVKSEN